MEKEQIDIVKNSILKLEEIDVKFNTLVNESVVIIDAEIENLGNLADKLQAKFDEMDEEEQVGDEGTELEALVELVSEAKTELEDLKDEIDSAPCEEAISKLESIEVK